MSKQTLVKTKTSISVGTKIGLVALMLGAFVSFGLFAMLPMKALDIDGDGGGGGGDTYTPPVNTCWESDGGDPYVFGTTHTLTNDFWSRWFIGGDREVVNYDECHWSSNKVFERTCNTGTDAWVQLIDCPYGCFEGRCTYEYETCPAGWYCYSVWDRQYINSDCMVENFENAPENMRCVNGEFEAFPGGWDWTNSTL